MTKTPIIYIGGVPGIGKTSYAAHISKEFGIGILLSGDYMREFLKGSTISDSDKEALKYSVYDSWKLFGDKTDENIIKGFMKQGEIVNKGMDALIDRAKANGEGMVLESLYFIPEQIKALSDKNVIKFYIYISDREKHKQRLLERSRYTHPNSPGDRLAYQIDIYRKIMEHSLASAKERGIRTFDNTDYMATRAELVNYIRGGLTVAERSTSAHALSFKEAA